MISWLWGGLTVPEVPLQERDDVVGVELGLTPGGLRVFFRQMGFL